MDPARAIIDANRFMTLATADAAGVPWASPVWFAPDGERDFLWVSDPDAQHSRNLAVRPELAIVIFDSRVAPARRRRALPVRDRRGDRRGIEVFSAHSVAQGLPAFTREDVTGAAPLRLYRARGRASAGCSDRAVAACPRPSATRDPLRRVTAL